MTLLFGLILNAMVASDVWADSTPVASTGPGNGIVVQGQNTGCGIDLFTPDGTYENGYAWQYGGLVAPDFGAFAECYNGVGLACRALFDFTQVGNTDSQTMDVYLWLDAGGVPGPVLEIETDVSPGPVAFWPSLSRHEVAVSAPVNGDFWVGYWGRWPDGLAAWFVGADTDGVDDGCPSTNYAPGIGFPTGWGNVSAAWGPTQSLGIGVALIPGGIGACCYADGSCIFQDLSDCTGQFLGPDVPCEPNPCDQPAACCFDDGSCAVLVAFECLSSDGTPINGSSCDPNPCDQPSACCFVDGSCLVLVPTDCDDLDGQTFAEEMSCAPNPCPALPTGACCFVGGDCIVIDVLECAEIDGLFQGADTSCDPNPCAAALGACCYPAGRCEIRTEDGCDGDGAYLGADTTCEPNPCPGLEPGACCLVFTCNFVDEFECLDVGGTFLGESVSCDPNPCGSAATGACCLSDGTCTVLSQTDCVIGDGTFQGDGTSCDPNPCPIPVNGACCLAQGICEVNDDLLCATAGGAFQGEGSSCDPNPCPQPCTPFALNGRPSTTLPQPPFNPFLETAAHGGRSQLGEGDGANRGGTLVLHTNGIISSSDACGEAAVSGCSDIVARSDEELAIDVHVIALFSPEADPRLTGVTFGIDFPVCVGLSDWAACADFELPTNNWPEPGTGTAVTWTEPQTNAAVEVYWLSAYGSNTERGQISLTEHPSQGAFFADDAIPARLDPIVELGSLGFFQDGVVPCPVAQEPLGACCIENICVQLTYDSCIEDDGIFVGVDVPCDPSPCSPDSGACCLPDGSCVETTPAGCNVLAGEYKGNGTICTPTICDSGQTFGACCFIDQSCLVLREDECLDAEGIFKGPNADCDPDPCFLAGGCCFDTGSCVEMFWFDCFDAGGEFLGDGVFCDTDVCPPAGACCFEDGSCLDLIEEICNDQSGTFQGDETTCAATSCPQPTPGACCFDDGSCTFVDRFECAFQLGEFLGEDLVCDPNPCPQPQPGACCFEDGSCEFVDIFGCSDLGGDFQGEGGSCDPNPCPQPEFGACCLPDGSCAEIFDFECSASNGLFGGDGTLCDDVNCDRPCNPPPLANRGTGKSTDGSIFGADASAPRLRGPNAGGTLVLHVDPDVSMTNAGDFCDVPIVPDCESVVSRADTSEPVSFWALAAFPGGSSPRLAGVAFGITYPTCFVILDGGGCGDFELPTGGWPDAGSGTAVTWTAARTETFVPVYWFSGYEDAVEPITVDLIPHPTQGAVFADDSIPAELDDIAALGNLGFRVDGNTPCNSSDAPGACCFADGSCEVLFASECDAGGGDFQGAGTSCDPNPCSGPPAGACCFQDGSCQVLSDDECSGAGGDYQGDGTVCDPNPCSGTPRGACCLADGSCQVRTADWCNTQGGDYQGDGTTCDPNPCPQPMGACCLADGSCQLSTAGDCQGFFLGDGTNCDPNPCPQGPSGACCYAGGVCEIANEGFCNQTNGNFQGEGTDCDPNPCPVPKVCCVDDQCFAIGFDCEQLGGVWVHGVDSCDPNPCPVTGACCFPDETCQVLFEFDCESAGGGFVGLGVPCDPFPCDTVPTIESTWGKIKERFRSLKR